MPPLVVDAVFGLILTNPYELAHKAMENEGRPWPPPDEMKELRRLIVNSGSLRFVEFHIFISLSFAYASSSSGCMGASRHGLAGFL